MDGAESHFQDDVIARRKDKVVRKRHVEELCPGKRIPEAHGRCRHVFDERLLDVLASRSPLPAEVADAPTAVDTKLARNLDTVRDDPIPVHSTGFGDPARTSLRRGAQ